MTLSPVGRGELRTLSAERGRGNRETLSPVEGERAG
jgi:hypothetical protein